MKPGRIFFYSILALQTLVGSAQTFVVSPKDLSSWSTSGADVQDMARSPQIVLPAAAQLSHAAIPNDSAVSLTSRPVVGKAASDWPVLELGGAALVFLPEGDEGTLVLVLDDNAPVSLPVSFVLDSAGRAVAPIHASISCHGNVVTIGVDDQSWTFSSKASTTSAQEIVLSAGASAPWELDVLQLSLPESPVKSSSSSTSSNAKTEEKIRLVAAAKIKTATPNGIATADAKPADSTSATSAVTPVDGPPALEIFTPPSVRFGRADAARQIIVQGKN